MAKGQQVIGNYQVTYTQPLVNYKNTKANIEALSGIAEGAIAYATDTDQLGSYNGATWTWGTGTTLISGTYTPTLYNSTNVAASTLNADFTYMRIGNIVIVAGSVGIDPTATGLTLLGASLPIASTFADTYDVEGTGTSQGATDQVMNIRADTTNHRAEFVVNAKLTTNANYRFVFVYEIL